VRGGEGNIEAEQRRENRRVEREEKKTPEGKWNDWEEKRL